MNLYVEWLTQGKIIQVRPLLGDNNINPVPDGLGCSCLEYWDCVCVTLLGRRGWAYIECALYLHCLVMGLNYKVNDGCYYNEKRPPITAIT